MRSVDEWIGKTDDDGIPGRVMIRIFDRYEGRCQCGCNRKIMPGENWVVDHRIALINGGEHRERNLQPLIGAHHQVKTRQDVAIKSKIARTRSRHLGIKRKRSSLPCGKNSPFKKKVTGEVVRRNP